MSTSHADRRGNRGSIPAAGRTNNTGSGTDSGALLATEAALASPARAAHANIHRDAAVPSGAPGWCPPKQPLLAIVVSTNERPPRLRQWIRYHQIIGFSLFYLFVEGAANAPDAIAELRTLAGVKVFPPDERHKWWHTHTRIHREGWLDEMYKKPCSGDLVFRQVFNIEIGIHQARVDGAAWLGHIDTDELLYPSSSANYSMHEVLARLKPKVDSVMFPSYEAVAEHDQVADPLAEVTLFKTSMSHADQETMWSHYHDIAHGNPTYFVAYDTGKSLARVSRGLRSFGPHLWENYLRSHHHDVHPKSGVLHFTYNRESDLVSRRDRCHCPPTVDGADICFWLPFDKQAFLAASLKTKPELHAMFRERLVWDDAAKVNELMSLGLLQRIDKPSAMLSKAAEGSTLAQRMPRRSSARQAADAAFRRVAGTTVGNFTYADLRPGGSPTSCEQYAAEDSSLTILDLMGRLPPANRTGEAFESDAVLVSRMFRFPGMPAPEVVPVEMPTPSLPV